MNPDKAIFEILCEVVENDQLFETTLSPRGTYLFISPIVDRRPVIRLSITNPSTGAIGDAVNGDDENGYSLWKYNISRTEHGHKIRDLAAHIYKMHIRSKINETHAAWGCVDPEPEPEPIHPELEIKVSSNKKTRLVVKRCKPCKVPAKVIVDGESGLMWDNLTTSDPVFNYPGSKVLDAWWHNVNAFAGCANWRLPTLDELSALWMKTQAAPLNDRSLAHLTGRFVCTRSDGRRWTVLFPQGELEPETEGVACRVLVCRDMERKDN